MSHIYGFNALRAFSVLLVILSHIGIVESTTNPLLVRFFNVFNANYGVKTFFVLSGFLITTLLIREYESTGRISIKNFMARRALRILPLYFLILAILSLLIFAGIAQPSWRAMGYSAVYLFNFVPKAYSVNYLSHLWSLAVEEQFYLVWPLVFALIFGKRVAIIGFVVAILLICYMTWPAPWPSFKAAYYPNRWTIPAIYPIAFGALAALIIAHLQKYMSTFAGLALACVLVTLPLHQPIARNTEFLGTAGIALIIVWIYLNRTHPTAAALRA